MPGHGDVVEHREVLDELAEADAAGVRAHRHAELRGHQDDGEVFVHAAEPAAVDLAEADRAGLQQLLEDHAIRAVLAGRDADRRDGPRDRRVSEHVVRTRRLLDPPQVEVRRARGRARSPRPRPSSGWRRSSACSSGRSPRRTSPTRRASSSGRRADLHLEMRPARRPAPRGTARGSVVRVAHPADGRRVGGIAVAEQLALRARPWSVACRSSISSASSGVSASVM